MHLSCSPGDPQGSLLGGQLAGAYPGQTSRRMRAPQQTRLVQTRRSAILGRLLPAPRRWRAL